LAMLVMSVLAAGCHVRTQRERAGPVAQPGTSTASTPGPSAGTGADSPMVHDAPIPHLNGRLAFQRGTDIYTAWPDGSGLTALTNTPSQNELGPVWSPTGTKIAFWRALLAGGPGSIWTMKGDGTLQGQLTSGIDARDPAWNPSGTRIAFTVADATGFHIWTMRASDGGDRRQVTSGPGLDFEPAWSPDGTRLAFTRGFEEGDTGDICVINLENGVTTFLTHSPEYDVDVAWSPDSSRVVFERDFGSSSSIYVIDADGSPEIRLTSGMFDNGPTFSPDGRFIAFGRYREGVINGLSTMTPNGHQLRSILQSTVALGFPDWQPLRG
jgi:TolB protein